MAEVREEIQIDRSPDEVWKVLADWGNIATWVPALESSEAVSDDTRRVSLGNGAELVEKILQLDDRGRTLTYTVIESPVPLDDYQSTMMVQASGEGSTVIWSATLSPDDVAPMITDLYRGGLQALKQHVEG